MLDPQGPIHPVKPVTSVCTGCHVSIGQELTSRTHRWSRYWIALFLLVGSESFTVRAEEQPTSRYALTDYKEPRRDVYVGQEYA